MKYIHGESRLERVAQPAEDDAALITAELREGHFSESDGTTNTLDGLWASQNRLCNRSRVK